MLWILVVILIHGDTVEFKNVGPFHTERECIAAGNEYVHSYCIHKPNDVNVDYTK